MIDLHPSAASPVIPKSIGLGWEMTAPLEEVHFKALFGLAVCLLGLSGKQVCMNVPMIDRDLNPHQVTDLLPSSAVLKSGILTRGVFLQPLVENDGPPNSEGFRRGSPIFSRKVARPP